MNTHFVDTSHPCAAFVADMLRDLMQDGKGSAWVSPRCDDRQHGEIEYDTASVRVCELPEGAHPSQGYTWGYTTPAEWLREYEK